METSLIAAVSTATVVWAGAINAMFSMVIAVRVGYHLGRGDGAAARKSFWLATGVVFAMVGWWRERGGGVTGGSSLITRLRITRRARVFLVEYPVHTEIEGGAHHVTHSSTKLYAHDSIERNASV